MKPSLLPYLVLTCLSALSFSARADEIHSNGLGGGKWSDAGTWEEKHVPAPVDTVVIASGDVVTFDRDDSAVISCAALSLDPEAQFEFQSGAGKKVLRVNGSIEAYGHIRIDASQAPTDQLEIQLLGDQAPKLSLFKGGGLIVSGAPNLPDGRKNIAIKNGAVDANAAPLAATLELSVGGALDVKNASIENISITCTGINNTGLKPNERLNFTNNVVLGGNLTLTKCDTPRIANNVFTAAPNSQVAGISVSYSPMSEIKANQISGYYYGISHTAEDVMITDNIIDKCNTGISYYANQNAMIRGGKISNCKLGINMTWAGGVIEEMQIENCETGIGAVTRSAFQINNVAFTPPATGAKIAIDITTASVSLLNCNVAPEQVKFTGPPAPPVTPDAAPVPALVTVQYVIAKVNGTLPAGAEVKLQTADGKPLAKGASDPNVRNSPAPLRPDGLSPLPATMGALVVMGWGLGPDGSPQAAPSYKLSVITPSATGDGTEIKSTTVKPDAQWYRPDLSSEKPTVEISL